MHKKTLAICAALVALGALVIAPSMASAAVTLKDTTAGGTIDKVEIGKKIVGYSTGVSLLESAAFNVECNENIMTGTVVKNDGTTVEGTIEDAWFQSNLNASGTDCRVPGIGAAKVTIPALTNGSAPSKHWCIKTIANTDEWEINGNNCGAAAAPFTFIIDGAITCGFTRTAAITGTFTTDTTGTHAATTLTMSGSPKFTTESVTSHSIFCPSEGTLKNLKFHLYTDTGTTNNTYPDSANTGDPLFFKNEA